MDQSIMVFTSPKCSTNTCQVNNQVLVPNNTTNVLKSVENITDGWFLPYNTGQVFVLHFGLVKTIMDWSIMTFFKKNEDLIPKNFKNCLGPKQPSLNHYD
jgi:hypothetical protein